MLMGAYNRNLDVVYLSRNAYFEKEPVEEVLPVICSSWKEYNEPAVVSTHRCHYVSLKNEIVADGFSRLNSLLAQLCQIENLRFISSCELGSLYSKGWSIREIPNGAILRKWHPEAAAIRISGVWETAVCAKSGKSYQAVDDKGRKVFTLPEGDYLLSK